MKHLPFSALARTAVVLVGALGLAACSDSSLGADGSIGGGGADAGAAARCMLGLAEGLQCTATEQCQDNLICDRSGGGTEGTCRAVTGQCDPDEDPANQCFPGARCEDLGGGQGRCTLASQAVRFFPSATAQRVVRPAERAAERRLAANETVLSAFTFEWERPAGASAEATTVLLVMKSPPRRDARTNRLLNISDVVWAWSTDLRDGTSEQSVNLDRGRAGFTPEGRLHTTRVTTLAVGKYWYFVYTLDRGRVSAASDVNTLQVLASTDAAPGMCRYLADCVRGDDNSDQWECVANRCARRCSSASDCVGTGMACSLSTPACRTLPRHGAFCGGL